MNAMLACPANYHDQSDIAGYVLGNYTDVYPSSITNIASGVNYGCNNYKTFAGYSSPLSSSEIFSCLSVGYLVQAELQYYNIYEEPTPHKKMVIVYEAYYDNSTPYVRYYSPVTGSSDLTTLESFYNANAAAVYRYVRTVRKI
ncbi:MAG: hypothetical protein IJR91_08195 [Ruminococcus sp.]|nr:hypothetical protein [Ruminococcus sp.]